ncbi:hypothetical protein R6Q59_008789 [Mikania micrantha]
MGSILDPTRFYRPFIVVSLGGCLVGYVFICDVLNVPKVNGALPAADEATSDHQRLMDRLQIYDLVELKVSGGGNCQFRSLSDQIYRSSEHHKLVREQVVHQFGVKIFVLTSFKSCQSWSPKRRRTGGCLGVEWHLGKPCT